MYRVKCKYISYPLLCRPFISQMIKLSIHILLIHPIIYSVFYIPDKTIYTIHIPYLRAPIHKI